MYLVTDKDYFAIKLMVVYLYSMQFVKDFRYCPKPFPLGAGSICQEGGPLKFGGWVKRREATDFRSPEVGISSSAIYKCGYHICMGNSMICSDIWHKFDILLYVISQAVRRVKFETILKYHEWYLCQISCTNHAIICLHYYLQKVCNFHM